MTSNNNYYNCIKSKKNLNTLYRRPGYHYTPNENWMSDPNGLIYHEGEYHFFYQYDFFESVFSNMSWGHAVSKDLLHWKELNPAICPNDDGLGMIFSGCTIIDKDNKSGYGKNTMFAYYTSTIPRQLQSMAYSKDKGMTWTKYDKNPIILNDNNGEFGNDFRDPKVFWFEEYQKWVMSVAARDHIQFWISEDLLTWKKESTFGQGYGAHCHEDGGSWECPDLFKMPIDNGKDSMDKTESVWILLVSTNKGGPNGECGSQYFIGDFKEINGKLTFESFHKEVKWLDYGPDNFAGTTYTDLESKRIIMSWMSNWQYALDIPTSPWRGVASIPRELKLKRVNGQMYLQNYPIDELKTLYKGKALINGSMEANRKYIFEDISSSRVFLSFDDFTEDFFEIELSNINDESIKISYDKSKSILIFDRRKSGLVDFNNRFANVVHTIPVNEPLNNIEVDILIDKMTIEVFFNRGLYSFSGLVFPNKVLNSITVHTNANIINGELFIIEEIMHKI